MNKHPRKREGITEQQIGDELYLFGTDGEKLTVLNATSMLIWSLCDGAHGLTEMTNVLQDIFADASANEVSTDINECLRLFQKQGILQEASEA